MWTRNNRLRCDICGKLMSWNNYYSWTPFGNSTMTEPPEDEHAHKECFESQEDGGSLIINTSWIKPSLHNDREDS